MYPDIEERVNKIEDYMAQLAYQQIKTEMSLRSLSDEMKEFKNEMKEFKNEMRQEHKNMKRQWNKQWGELSNKMGTLVEDIIAPSVRPVLKKYFGIDTEYFAVNVRKHRKDINMKGEFDIIACCENTVFLVEVKSRPRKEYLYDFLENIKKFSLMFSEYRDMKLIPIFAGLRFEHDIINLATENRIYAMAFREWEYMDILNFSEIGN